MALKQESYMNSKNSSRYMENVFIEKKNRKWLKQSFARLPLPIMEDKL